MTRLKTVDAARGLAEFWVLAFHAFMYIEMGAAAGVIGPCPRPHGYAQIDPLIAPHSTNWIKPLLGVFEHGDLGVTMFFVVSGFCIHWPAARAGQAFQFNLGYYWKRRFWRLYPTHLAAIIGSMLLAWALWSYIESKDLGNCVKVPWSAFVAHFFMLQAQIPYTSQYTYCYNPNLWSLETEFQLYACYCLLLPIGRRIGWGRLLLCLLPISLAWHKVLDHHRLGEEYFWPEQTCCIGHLFSWTLGAFVAESICRRSNPLPVLGWSAFGLAAVQLFVSFDQRWIYFMSGALGTAFILWHLANRERMNGLTFPGCDWLGWWGHRSYSLYLWHAPILRVFIVIASIEAPWIKDNFYYGYAMAVIAAVAALYVARLSYWTVERHFIKQPGVSEPEPALALAAG
jgi:peptidoglycan/LPS O-acetylase OafA/YrhL